MDTSPANTKKVPKVLVFASGTATGGGTGFQNLVEWSRANPGTFEVVAVACNHQSGGVRQKAEALGVPFALFSEPWPREGYQQVAKESGAEFFALSGWLKQVHGLDPARTFNIHPALLSIGPMRFGGKSMYGEHVLAAVYDAIQKGEIDHFGISMHFVTEEFDSGPVFFEIALPVKKDIPKEVLGAKTHSLEIEWQPKITNLVANYQIRWDGTHKESLVVPVGYEYLPNIKS